MKGKISWLSEHLERFVVPFLGFAPIPNAAHAKTFTADEMTVLKNVWRSSKRAADGRPITLLGRDVFIFETLARREGYPTRFLPQVSRLTALNFRFDQNTYTLDTGFVGNIPRDTGIKFFSLVSADSFVKSHQVFPHLTGSRRLALKIEITPKYWKRAYIDPVTGDTRQEYSDREEFARAAILTSEIYKDSSSSFVPRHQPIGDEYGYR